MEMLSILLSMGSWYGFVSDVAPGLFVFKQDGAGKELYSILLRDAYY